MAEKRMPVLVVLLAVVFSTAIIAGAASNAGELVWKNKAFKYNARGEDVQDTLRNIAKMAGFEIIFTGTVKGEVTRAFDDINLQGAFNMLIEEFSLEAEWNPEKKFMVVHQKKTDAKQVVELVRLKSMDPEEVKGLLADFNIKLTKFEIHKNIRSILLKGPQDDVQTAVKFIKELDTAASDELTYELHRKSLKMVSAGDIIEVIRLKYATAGKTSLKLGDQTLSIPGIDETIKEILGYSKEIKAQQEKNTAEILKNPVAIADLLKKNETMEKTSKQESQPNTMPEMKPTGDNALSDLLMNEILNKPPTISIDQRTNSVIVKGRPEQVEMVRKLIQELDRPTPLVEMDVMIVEANDGFERSLGVNWNLSGTVGKRKQEFNMGTSQAISPIPSASPSPAPSLISAVNPSLAFLYNTPFSQLSAQMTALDSEGLGKILSSPRLVTLDNKEANIHTGSSVYVVPTGTFTTSSPTAISTGITLKVTPHMIIPNDPKDSRRFRLVIHAEKSSFDYSFTTAGNIPETVTEEINTEVIMDENQTLVLGGLFETSKSTTESGVPFLKDIPILGYLFKTKSDTKSRKELLFFITPSVVETSVSEARAILEETYKEQNEKKLQDNIKKSYPIDKKPATDNDTADKSDSPNEPLSQTSLPETSLNDKPHSTIDKITVTDVMSKDAVKLADMTKTDAAPANEPFVREYVEAFLLKWKSKWQARDLEGYASLYNPSFSSGNMTLKDWKASKKNHFSSEQHIKVDISDLNVQIVSPTTVKVGFKQHYSSNTVSDTGLKTMILTGCPGNCKIQEELWSAPLKKDTIKPTDNVKE